MLSQAQITTSPAPAIANAPVTLNFNKAGTPLASYTGTIYAHIGVTVNGARWQRVIGDWGLNVVFGLHYFPSSISVVLFYRTFN